VAAYPGAEAGDDVRAMDGIRGPSSSARIPPSPLIVARMDDETRFMSFARRAAELCGYAVWPWSATLGLARDGNASQVDTQEPKKALAFVRQLQAPAV
jgi:hypothetical protein